MKYLLFTFIFIIGEHIVLSQEEPSTTVVDSLYKEDQFYVGMTYNLLVNRPNDINQSGFSSGFHLGFIKDMPINKNRNVAIGIGLGYSGNSFNQNMLINKNDVGNFTYSVLNDTEISYTKNKFSTHMVELPIEFRWRTSTATEYRFWRIYTGFKMGYVFAHTSKFKGDLGSLEFNDDNDFNDFQYGLTLSVGYNTWNIHFYYALNPIFSGNAKLNDDVIDMSAIKIGLMFYIL